MIIGLTGSFGSGKSTAAALFAKRGAKVIDADIVIRRLLEQNKKIVKKVAKVFPGAILKPGRVNRKTLAKVVFQNPRELKKLTDILYPEALKEVRKQISLNKQTNRYYSKYEPSRLQKQSGFIVLDVPLLFEAGWQKLADVTVVVRASRQQQIERLRKRSGLSKSEILTRLKLQMPMNEKIARADIIIDNRGTLKNMHRQVDAIVNRLNTRKK